MVLSLKLKSYSSTMVLSTNLDIIFKKIYIFLNVVF